MSLGKKPVTGDAGQRPPTPAYPVTQSKQIAMPVRSPATLPSVFRKGK